MFSVSYKRSTDSPFCDQRLTHFSGNVQLLLHPGKKGPHDNVLIKFITNANGILMHFFHSLETPRPQHHLIVILRP
jgi:hypothetical protein